MKPSWLDERLYPFRGRTLEVGPGEEIHYLDEGEGEPILFVHGTPTWSFVWRQFVAELRDYYRCIAPDHLGFGLSSKPAGADYAPAAHARRLAELVARLDLRDATLVVHDFGGPIGLHYALGNRRNVRAAVVMNSWIWPLAGNGAAASASRLLGSPLGRFLYRRLNFSPRFLLPAAFARKGRLKPEVHRHYLSPFPTIAQRMAPWVLARELIGSNEWYAGLWSRREALQRVPLLILWGMRDPLLSPAYLARWSEAFPSASIARLDDAGHFVQEEAAAEAIGRVKEFLAQRA